MAGNRRIIPKFRKTRYSVDETLQIKDKDLQKFMLLNGNVEIGQVMKHVNNNEKLGWYRVQESLRVNNEGVCYKHSQLVEYLVYNKGSKKVKLSKAHTSVVEEMMKVYINTIGHMLLPRIIGIHFTPTLCKKIIEGKIETVGDVIKYMRSYCLRKKDISIDLIYKWLVLGISGALHVIEDPENVDANAVLTVMGTMFPHSEMVRLRLFKIKASEITSVNEKYSKWTGEQSEKFDTFTRHRYEEAGCDLMQIPF